MDSGPAYVVVGRGRWAQRMREILLGENRRVAEMPEARRNAVESDSDYEARLAEGFRKSNARIAWLCVPPGPHVCAMVKAGIQAGLNVVAEKPWFASPAETRELQALARRAASKIAVHYEYCMLDEVESWRRRYAQESGLDFSGTFHHGRPNHLPLDALDNLGTHLVSIRNFAVPLASVAALNCAHGRPDERAVWIERQGTPVDRIDLLGSRQPIIQRFAGRFEAALEGGSFPFDLDFALGVSEQLAAFRRNSRLAAS